jgi:hypothetical protein
MTESSNTRRDFVKKAAYVAPAILTLAAVPSYAKFGSSKLDDSIRGISGSNGIGNTASNYGNRNYGNRYGNRNNGNNGNSALHAQSQFHANPYADYRARHGFIDYSGKIGPDSD